MKTCYTKEQIETSVKAKGYKWFEDDNNKGYDVNIVGVRNSETKGRVTNAFDDCITISYKIEGEWQFHCFQCTTDPGSSYMNNPIVESKGTAILKPNQYRGSHKLRLHAGKYLALGQKKDVTVYRDNDRDDKYDLDESKTDTGLFGINIHRATGRSGGKSTRVDKWSAGCQVIADNDDWHEFLDICQAAREIHGNSFSYTLLESNDLV
tara:strand:- start:183 stop:806 length:624 start_codon:yes stop_codon:yes gene_type:complete